MPNKLNNDIETTKAPVVRRGVSVARGTTRLKFSHEQAKNNGLFVAHLDSVETSMIKIGEDTTGMPSFNGYEIPKIVFTFSSNEEDVNKRHYVTLQFTAVESNVNTIPGGKEEWKVNTIFDWFKHILNVYYLRGKEMSDDMAVKLSLPFDDFDEQGQYIPIDSETVIAGWKTLFENFAYIMNHSRDDSPCYKTSDGKIIPVWIKLIRYTKARDGWKAINNGNLAFPAFVGEGCIEIFKQNIPTSIRVDGIRESIIPMNIEKAKTPNMPTPGNMPFGGPMSGGAPIGDPMGGISSGINDIIAEAGSGMPF